MSPNRTRQLTTLANRTSSKNEGLWQRKVDIILFNIFPHPSSYKIHTNRCHLVKKLMTLLHTFHTKLTLVHASMWCCSRGAPAIGNSGRETSNESGRNRVPKQNAL